MAANRDKFVDGVSKVIRDDMPKMVRDRNRTVLAAFEQCLALLPESVSPEARERFKAVGSELGIESGVLDRMLRRSSSLRQILIQQLTTLKSVLLVESPNHSGKIKMRKLGGADIEAAVTRTTHSLLALLSALKEPTPSDDIQRLSKSVVEDAYTKFDITRIKDKFPRCQEKLQRRLGILNRLRRLRFQDTQSGLLRKVQNVVQRDFEARQNPTGPLILDDTNTAPTGLLDDIAPGDLSDTSSITSYSSGYYSLPLGMDTKAPNPQDMPELEPHTTTSISGTLQIPSMPAAIRKRTNMRCPFCYSELDENVDDSGWRDHVIEDLEPYMCTFGGCSQSYRTYGSLEDWQRHENTKHRLQHLWLCHDCDESWTCADEFKAHMTARHQGTFMPSQLGSIARLCKVVRFQDCSRKFCLLCGTPLNGDVQAEYDHLSGHLLDIALFVLPRFDEEEGGIDAGLSELNFNDDDSRSDLYDPPETITDLRNPKAYLEDEVIPFTYVKLLSRGSVATVYSAICSAGPTQGTLYAIKSMRFPHRGSKLRRLIEMLSTEAQTLARLRHVHVVAVVSSFIQKSSLQKSSLHMVMLPLADSNLLQLLARDDRKVIKTKWFGCLASGLAYLHGSKVRHRDIKPSNILVQGNRILFGDFMTSRERIETEESESAGPVDALTEFYAAPEVLNFDARSSSADVFSLGCVFLEMLSALSAISGSVRDFLQDSFKRGGYARNIGRVRDLVGIMKRVGPDGTEVILKCCESMLEKDRRNRPTAQQVLDIILDGHVQNMATSKVPLIGKCYQIKDA